MKLLEQQSAEWHSHNRYVARQAKELVVGDSVMKNGATLEVVSVVWTFQLGDQFIWSSFGVRNLNTQRQFLLTLRLNEWALLDTYQSKECGCKEMWLAC